MFARVDVVVAADCNERGEVYEVFHWAIDAKGNWGRGWVKRRKDCVNEEEDDRSRLFGYEYAIVSRSVEEIEKNARRADGRIANS